MEQRLIRVSTDFQHNGVSELNYLLSEGYMIKHITPVSDGAIDYIVEKDYGVAETTYPEYDQDRAVKFIQLQLLRTSSVGLSDNTVHDVLDAELDYMRSIGIVED